MLIVDGRRCQRRSKRCGPHAFPEWRKEMITYRILFMASWKSLKTDDIKRKFAPHNAVNGLNSPSHIWRSSGSQIFWTCVEFWVWSESEWDFVTLARSQNALWLKCHRQSWWSGVLGILQLESVLFYSIYGDWGWYWANPQLSFWATGSHFNAIKPLIAYNLGNKKSCHTFSRILL